jgi:ABC-2 type transport system ATP-binding protein
LPPVIETVNLTKIFGNRLIAVNNMNLQVEEGATYGVLGPNGAGKTTLIRLLLGLIKPTAGKVRVFGKEMTINSADLRQKIGYLPTNPKFPPRMTPITYLDFIGRLFNMTKDERMNRLSKLLRAVDLLPSASREIKGFSTGMVTRLGLAASLMNDPELLILDEPTSGLDPAGRKSTLDLLEEIGKKKTILISSHILSDIDRVCNYVGIINEGKVISSGSIKDMKKLIKNNVVRLEIEGNLEPFCTKLTSIEGIASVDKKEDFIVDIALDDKVPSTQIVKEIVDLVSDSGLDLISINSSTSRIEDAFLKLTKEEESTGFLRAVNS